MTVSINKSAIKTAKIRKTKKLLKLLTNVNKGKCNGYVKGLVTDLITRGL